MAIKQVSLVSSVIVSFYCLMAINSAQAQIIPDSTTDADVIDSCANSCNITGGKLAGENLFHSFQEFSIRQGESVYFADPGVANIFSRVTGNNASQIFGTLGVSGNATLFLLNPNGIIFGEGATLDINGSFFATTADEIQFGDLGSFAAVSDSSENLTLLTVNPNALLFNQMGQQGAIAKLAEGIAINNTSLNLPETETLTLLGKQTTETTPGINLSGGEIIIPQGNINLGSVSGNGKVDIDPNGQLEFPRDITKGDIFLSNSSNQDVSGMGAGNVSLQGKDINISGESQIFANTLGDISGGAIEFQAENITLTENADLASKIFGNAEGANIKLIAEETINLVGNDPEALQRFLGVIVNTEPDVELSSTVIFTNNLSADPSSTSGDITLQSKNLNLSNSAWILASVNNRGEGGRIKIDVEKDITIDNAGLITGVDEDKEALGDTGSLTVNAQNLYVSSNSIISSATTGGGSGGDLNLNITDTL